MVEVAEALDALVETARAAGYSDSDDEAEGANELFTLEDKQAELCQKLIACLDRQAKEAAKAVASKKTPSIFSENVVPDSSSITEDNSNFIRTSIAYNNKTPNTSGRHTRITTRRKGSSGLLPSPGGALTVREIFAQANASTSRLPPLLASLITTRIETERLLPATQDLQANEEAMSSNSAITLTEPALTATHLYAKLLAMPGAWGSGLVQMEAVTALAALCRRWRLECIAAIDLLASGSNANKNKAANNKRTGKRKASKKASKAPPLKRSRGRTRVNFEVSSDEGEDDADEDGVESGTEDDNQEEEGTKMSKSFIVEEDGFLPPKELMRLGLLAAKALCEVPLQKEFLSWSSEAREAVMDGVTALYGTTCALVIPSAVAKLGKPLMELGSTVVQQGTECLKRCILNKGPARVDVVDQETEPDSEIDDVEETDTSLKSKTTKRHETAVFIFRGLYPIISMKEELPNGDAGKYAACSLAAETLEGIVRTVAKHMTDPRSHQLLTPGERSMNKTPNHTRSGHEEVPNSATKDIGGPSKTPFSIARKGRKKRVSFGGLPSTSNLDSNTTGEGAPPILKANRTPSSIATTPGGTLMISGAKPRPVFSAVLGLMQKLATSPGLQRAHMRASVEQSLHRSLRHLPLLERTHFLRFLNQLSKSKVAIHRLFCCEIMGKLLSESWLWEDHAHQPSTSPLGAKVACGSRTPGHKTPLNASSCRRVPGSGQSLQDCSNGPVKDYSQPDLPTAMLHSLKERLTDRAPAVRARAAGSLSDVFQMLALAKEEHNHMEYLAELDQCISSTGGNLLYCLRKRASIDKKATVRRAAAVALTELLFVGQVDETFTFGITEAEVAILGQLCRDPSMLTRKTAAQSLSKMLEKCCALDGDNNKRTVDLLCREWNKSVLPMVCDSEASCVATTTELVYSIMIQPIVLDEACNDFNAKKYALAWMLLGNVCESSGSQGAARGEVDALKVAISKLSVSEAAPKNFNRALLRRICDLAITTLEGTPEELLEHETEIKRSGVWCLFDALVAQTKDLAGLYKILKQCQIDLDFLGTSWEKMLSLLDIPIVTLTSGNLLRSCMRSCLRLLSKLAVCVQAEVAEKSAKNLHSMLKKFTLPPDLIGSAVGALAATSVVISGKNASIQVIRDECRKHIESLYKVCEGKIACYAKDIANSRMSETSDTELLRALFTVGELSVVGFNPDEDSHVPTETIRKKNDGATEADPLRGLHVSPQKQLVDVVLAFLPQDVLGSTSIQNSSSSRCFSLIAVGKMCLRDENLAKRSLTILSRELHENLKGGCPKMQSNALMVLSDLCIRYTNMVDRYLPVMAACLQSGWNDRILPDRSLGEAAIVRKHAVLLLSSLLLQDYIKFRGLLFHRFLVATADSDEGVASIASSLLTGPLLTKQPKLFYNHFVESLFVLNCCKAHPIYVAAASSGDGGSGITVGFEGLNLTGPAGRARRHKMYELMLSKMSPEDRIGCSARITKEILGSALSESDLHRVCINPIRSSDANKVDKEYESAFNVLSDAFAILCSPNLCVGKSIQAANDDDDGMDDPNVPNNTNKRVVAARGKLLSKISRTHLIEIVLPILCNLKLVLQKSCSPLLKDLMTYMVHIYCSYTDEVTDFLSNDPTLLQEIEYDAKKLKKGRNGGTPAPVVTATKSEEDEEE